jgi:hypothetical protein
MGVDQLVATTKTEPDAEVYVCDACPRPRSFPDAARLGGHMRWAHPNGGDVDGEMAGPPPAEARRQRQTFWEARMVRLDENPGVWIRWPYASQAGASSTVSKRRIRTDTARYRFEPHQVDGRWWVYGIRLTTEELN